MFKKLFIFFLSLLLLFSLFVAGCQQGPKYFVNVTIMVKDAETDNVVSGASVFGGGKTGTTDKSGMVVFSNLEGNKKYTFTVSAKNYNNHNFSLDVKTQSITYTATISKQKGSISGYVFDDKNNPVEDALISIPNTSLFTYSQPDGSFVLMDVPVSSTPYTIDITKDGFNSRKIYNVYVTSEKPDYVITKVVLTNQPGRLLGTVTDDKGSYLSDVTISVPEANKTGKTNNMGYYTIELLPGKYTVVFGHQLYQSRTEYDIEVKSNIDTTLNMSLLPKPGSLSGIVKDYQNKPISGVLVFLAGTSLSTVTDTSGYFFIDNIPPGDYVANFTSDYYKSETANVRIEKAAERMMGNIFMNPKTGSLTGRVVDKYNNSPISGAIVRSNTTLDSAVTTTDGSFQLNNIRIGPHILSATATDYSQAEVSVTVEEDKNVVIPDIKIFKNPGSIYGVVKDYYTGKFIEGATVAVIEIPEITGTTNSQGVFTVNNLPEGTYSIRISCDKYSPRTISNVRVYPNQATNMETIDLTPQLSTIKGKTTPGATVTLQATSFSTTASDAGDYIINNIPPGDYTIVFTKYNYNAVSQDITLGPGETFVLDMPLEIKKGKIYGTVVDEYSAAKLSGVSVSLQDVSGLSAVTDQNGYFEINNVPVGSYTMKFELSNYTTGYRDINVKEGSNSIDIFELSPVLCTLNGETTPGATVTLRGTTYNTTANSGGTFQITGIIPNNYTVDITKTNYFSKAIEIQLTPGRVWTIPKEQGVLVPMPGKITGNTNADKVTVYELGRIVTVTSSVFTVDNLEPGTYTLIFEKSGFKSQTKTYDVTANGTTNAGTITLEPYTGSITGYIMCSNGNVTLVDTKETKYFNNPAYFSFSNLTPGTYHLTLKKPGYISKFFEVTVEPNGTTDLGNIDVGPKFDWDRGSVIEVYHKNNISFKRINVDYPQTVLVKAWCEGEYDSDRGEEDTGVEVRVDGKAQNGLYGYNTWVERQFTVNNYIEVRSIKPWDYCYVYHSEDDTGPAITLSKSWDYGPTSVTISASDSWSGLNTLQYSLSQSPTSATTYNNISNGGSVSISSKGVWYLHVRATDKYENISTLVEGPFIVP